MCHFRVQKHPICPEQNSFGANHYYYFHLPIGPFHCAKLKKNSYRGSRVLKMYDIWTPNNPFFPNNFFWTITNIICMYISAPFIVQNFKKILPVDPELWGCAIFGPIFLPNLPKWEFFSENLLMSFISFIHAYLHAENQSQTLIS